MAAFRIDELRSPSAFSHPADRIVVLETHLSWVILAGEFAYKIKKPVRFDFIDATSLDQRRRLCEEELRLNQRLAPGLYVDVVPIVRQDGQWRIAGTGEPLEYAVRMRRFDNGQELAALLERGDVQLDEITQLAHLLADFHARAATAPVGTACTGHLREAIGRALQSLQLHMNARLELPGLDTLIAWTQGRLQGQTDALLAREAGGRIRECHGDLHARNIVRWQGALTPFDCLEFDPKLRWIDVMNDIAFLVMDLQSHARPDLAMALLNRYLEHTGDYTGLPLLPLYAVYRALVRAMVDALAAGQQPGHRADYEQRLRARLRAATGFASPEAPALLLMHGPSGSGKSWLSGQLVAALPALRIRSDLERRRLLAEPAIDAPASGNDLHCADFDHRTYARLLECAEDCLSGGFNTIVDATFLNPQDRLVFQRLAGERGIHYLIVACEADPAVLAERIRERQKRRDDPSDADVAVLGAQLRSFKPLEPDEERFAVRANTTRADALALTLAAIQRRLANARPAPRH